MRKKLLALLLAAALAISLLAGCGGGKALSQVIVDLLDNLYSNVSVEADSDLTAALKQAAAEGGTEEEILSRMIEILNHKGGSITFTRLGSGQQGEHGVTLYFQPGTDPDAAARNALAQWAGTLGTLPDDGSYQADVAMIETENGYYIALDVEVLKAGKPDKPDKDDDEPEQQEPTIVTGTGFTYNVTDGIITMKSEEGGSAVNDLQNLFIQQADEAKEITDARSKNFEGIIIELEAGETYTVSNQLTADFKGTLKGGSADNKAKIELSSTSGLFGTIVDGGEVSNLDITVSNTINGGGGNVGAVAGENKGTIQNCHVTGDTIQGPGGGRIGGIAGENKGTIQGCSSAIAVKDGEMVGGIAGSNYGGSIIACYHETGTVQGSFSTIGGVVGYNWNEGKIIACYSTSAVQGYNSGGVVGQNGSYIGTASTAYVYACYWSGDVTSGLGIGYGRGDDTKVDGTTVTWQKAVDAMNTAITANDPDCPYKWVANGDGLPTLTNQ